MCIRDRWITVLILLSIITIVSIVNRNTTPENKVTWLLVAFVPVFGPLLYLCLLYTSDAADEARSVDLGGRRIIKKKIYKKSTGIVNRYKNE
ncbi:PLD nuclease N-terminal domain-containing protein [Streptococcus pneumoniae D39]|nr:PLD nuclease N-terminal domain-containing protein [Streptococcus pneumoniae D39]